MSVLETLKKYRLSQDEYQKIKRSLGRDPEGVEWALFSALWSEHCSYKSTRIHLKKFAFKSDHVLESMGENAGVVDLGQGERVAFKMESHNHPSFIEPYEGAATGVGGILRDIFTMGARPMALANYLCFGEMAAPRMKVLVEGVVAGISGYGNCVGVPNLTGQTEFHRSYNGNILVNAFALGYFGKNDKVFTSRTAKPGHLIVYVGAKTGRDGIHGASMASESFDENSESKRPTIQKGDPFYEKLLIEGCLEVMKEDLVSAIQDMGAAGLTSSSFEMASKCGNGFKMHLDKVPLRDRTMSPEDILLSESQERMLLVCEPQKFERIQEVFHQWDLDAEVIGEVTKDSEVELYWHNELLTKIHPDLLVEQAPIYDRPYEKAHASQATVKSFNTEKDLKNKFLKVLASETASSREWVYNQYDQRVGARTASDCSEPIGSFLLPESKRFLGIALGCRPYLMRWDQKIGAFDSVVEPCLQLAIKGYKPMAMTDCLNFGNPEKPKVMGQIVESIESMAEVSKALNVPVISGNVSLYNETEGENITPTPSTAIVGIKERSSKNLKSYFQKSNSKVYLLTDEQFVCNGLFGEEEHGKVVGRSQLDVGKINGFINRLIKISEDKRVLSTRLVGKYGLLYSLFRMCKNNIGFEISNQAEGAVSFFDETGYQVLIEVGEDFPENKGDELFSTVNALLLGITSLDSFNMGDFGAFDLKFLQQEYNRSLGGAFETME